MNVKHILTAALIFVAWVLGIVAATTAYYTRTVGSWGSVAAKLFTGTASSSCDIFEATRAFYVLTLLCASFLMVALIVRIFALQQQLESSPLKYVVLGLYGGIILFGLIAWALCFALYSTTYCGLTTAPSDLNSAEIGPSAPCMLVAWLLGIVGICAELFMPSSGGGGGEASSSAGDV